MLTPHWIENLSLSFDWYSITLHGGIFSPSSSQIIAGCAVQHNPNLCQFVLFGQGPLVNGLATSELDGNGHSPAGLIGGLTFAIVNNGDFNGYYQGPVNANRESVSGLDFQIDYRHDFFDGTMSYHVLGNYTDEKTRTSLGVTVDDAGAISGDAQLSTLGSLGFVTPKLHATVATTYDHGPWEFTAQARIIGSARLTNNLNQFQSIYTSIDNNSIPVVVYGDFRASYDWTDRISMYAAVDNLFDTPPPNIPTIGGGGTSLHHL